MKRLAVRFFTMAVFAAFIVLELSSCTDESVQPDRKPKRGIADDGI